VRGGRGRGTVIPRDPMVMTKVKVCSNIIKWVSIERVTERKSDRMEE